MPDDVRCPACGEEERVEGSREGELIRLACEACGHTWERDPRPRCPHCGTDDLRRVPKAVMGKARGEQRSIVGTVTVHLCPDCDRDLLDRHLRDRAPLPPDE